MIKVVIEKDSWTIYVKRSQDWKKSVLKLICRHCQGGFTGNFVAIGVHDLNVRGGGSYADFDYFNYQEIEME